MELNDSEKNKINKWLDKYWKKENRVCPVCSNNTWDLRDKIFEIPELPENNKLFGGVMYPVIVLKCTTCTYTLLFNAIDMGIVGSP